MRSQISIYKSPKFIIFQLLTTFVFAAISILIFYIFTEPNAVIRDYLTQISAIIASLITIFTIIDIRLKILITPKNFHYYMPRNKITIELDQIEKVQSSNDSLSFYLKNGKAQHLTVEGLHLEADKISDIVLKLSEIQNKNNRSLEIKKFNDKNSFLSKYGF